MATNRKRSPATVAARRLARVSETPIAPAWVVRAATGTPLRSDGAEHPLSAMQALEAEARAVAALAEAFGRLPPAWPADTEVTLL